jgi:hypothetical protein
MGVFPRSAFLVTIDRVHPPLPGGSSEVLARDCRLLTKAIANVHYKSSACFCLFRRN